MPSTSTVSVVLPNYNHADLIGRALSALLSQEHPADEIIVIDDASSDHSLDVITSIAAANHSVSILVNETNRGAISTLQRGLEAARGKYVYFAAADDWVLPGFFAIAVRRLEANPDLGLFCGEAILVNGADDRAFAMRPAVRPLMRAGRLDPGRIKALLRSTDNWILTGSAILRRECALRVGGFDKRLGSFADGFLVRKVALTFGCFFEPRAVSVWAIFSDSVSRKEALDLRQAMRFLDVVPKLIADDPVFPKWYPDAFRNRWRFATCRLALQANPIDRELVLAMGARSVKERSQLDKMLHLPGRTIARLATLMCLWYWLRPMSITPLLRTMLLMRTMRLAASLLRRPSCAVGRESAQRSFTTTSL
jgi:glycosyltransferase involved in cell wall biosynthesis